MLHIQIIANHNNTIIIYTLYPNILFYCALLIIVHWQQLGIQNKSVYNWFPVASSATKRFWMYFCWHWDLYPVGIEQIPLHSVDLWKMLLNEKYKTNTSRNNLWLSYSITDGGVRNEDDNS